MINNKVGWKTLSKLIQKDTLQKIISIREKIKKRGFYTDIGCVRMLKDGINLYINIKEKLIKLEMKEKEENKLKKQRKVNVLNICNIANHYHEVCDFLAHIYKYEEETTFYIVISIDKDDKEIGKTSITNFKKGYKEPYDFR